jgi:hypothetical protein
MSNSVDTSKKKTLVSYVAVQRPCHTHCFLTDAAEVQQMETVLLKLLDDFNSGKLRITECSDGIFQKLSRNLILIILPKKTTLPFQKTGGKFSSFKKRTDRRPFHLSRALVCSSYVANLT